MSETTTIINVLLSSLFVAFGGFLVGWGCHTIFADIVAKTKESDKQ